MIPRGPVLTPARLFAARTCAGLWWRSTSGPMALSDMGNVDTVCGIYFLLTTREEIVRMGQASRNDGLMGRVQDHLHDPEHRGMVRRLAVISLDDFCPKDALSEIEGRVATVLGLRRMMPTLRWPQVRSVRR